VVRNVEERHCMNIVANAAEDLVVENAFRILYGLSWRVMGSLMDHCFVGITTPPGLRSDSQSVSQSVNSFRVTITITITIIFIKNATHVRR